MSPLPLLLSLPHSGLWIPPALRDLCLLDGNQIVADGDEHAAEIYALREHVASFVQARVARAIVDLNRAPDDRRKDGVVKTHTCWDEPVYEQALPEALTQKLLREHYWPYHHQLSQLAGSVAIGVDCHTMVAFGPPIAPDPGIERPWICLSNGEGTTCPDAWMEALAEFLRRVFSGPVWCNRPFKGGYIVRRHATEMPWIQVEFSRAPFLPNADKRERFLLALQAWCHELDFH